MGKILPWWREIFHVLLFHWTAMALVAQICESESLWVCFDGQMLFFLVQIHFISSTTWSRFHSSCGNIQEKLQSSDIWSFVNWLCLFTMSKSWRQTSTWDRSKRKYWVQSCIDGWTTDAASKKKQCSSASTGQRPGRAEAKVASLKLSYYLSTSWTTFYLSFERFFVSLSSGCCVSFYTHSWCHLLWFRFSY